ncbi:MAG: diguanylate cyclase domain-containing protein [Thermosynechococcaceae cyanobacterium]
MSHLRDYTKINWDNEFSLDAPLDGIEGSITGEGAIESGDEIVLCIRCKVDEVERYANAPERWRAGISELTPVSIETLSEKSQVQLIEQLTTRLSAPLRQTELYSFFERLFTADGVTQVASRAKFDALVEQEWGRGQRDKTVLSVVLFRINGLQLDDMNVDPDPFLRKIAAVIQSTSKRATDVVARYHADTFALLLPNTPQAAAARLADEIQAKILAVLATTGSSSSPTFTLNLGIAGMVPTQALSAQALLEAAEQSLVS